MHSRVSYTTKLPRSVGLCTPLSPFPKPPPAPFLVVSYFPSPGESTSQWAPVPAHASPHQTLSHMTNSHISQTLRSEHVWRTLVHLQLLKYGSKQHRLWSSRSKGQKSGWPGLAASPSGVLGKTAANTTSEAESSPQRLQVSLHT